MKERQKGKEENNHVGAWKKQIAGERHNKIPRWCMGLHGFAGKRVTCELMQPVTFHRNLERRPMGSASPGWDARERRHGLRSWPSRWQSLGWHPTDSQRPATFHGELRCSPRRGFTGERKAVTVFRVLLTSRHDNR